MVLQLPELHARYTIDMHPEYTSIHVHVISIICCPLYTYTCKSTMCNVYWAFFLQGGGVTPIGTVSKATCNRRQDAVNHSRNFSGGRLNGQAVCWGTISTD